ncbi:DNA integrity scanning diadenylate cyclase DisA [Litorihabitans aurantiacus]|uniref:DNA integrity scanning protein DisA n=1 Tax=Litorihabitans aurantiacus TaxID=1930061 RepID=A0AA37UH35_9MICO|nr:DNA integrity scanning diadenylate cyclase DisA [Litorihabitans aurantiacus]GMA30324.1 DNA integrity scanning protein DisA [Litorihabitans aurantiacus]
MSDLLPGATGRSILRAIAPGTALRDGLERILRGRTGALIVVGHDEVVESICSGGFEFDVAFSSTRLRELAKMDGAIVLDATASRILRAAVQLLPDASIETSESGTRHRTAQRAAVQTGLPVISVSQSMRIVAVYFEGERYVLEDSGAILSRANQALATLERYKARLDEVSRTLSALEIEDLVTVRDVAAVIQRLEMVRRIALEISGYVSELGSDGRLLALQLEELVGSASPDRDLVVRDYLDERRSLEDALAGFEAIDSTSLIDLGRIARMLGIGGAAGDALDAAVSPRGYRMVAQVPRLPLPIVESAVAHFGSLQRMLAATVEDFQLVDGIGAVRARSLREGLSRLAETSLIDRFV